MRKRLVGGLVILTMVLALAACGKKNENNQDGSGQGGSQEASNSQTVTKEVLVPGTLYRLNKEVGEDYPLKGVRIDGNVAGSGDASGGVNGKEPATEKIRSIFELNEYLAFYFDTDVQLDETYVFCFEHRDDTTVYNKFSQSLLDQCVASTQLFNEVEGESWGEFYVNKEEHAPGYYDVIFVFENTTIAKMVVKLYAEGELSGKSDADLVKMMDDEAAAAKAK